MGSRGNLARSLSHDTASIVSALRLVIPRGFARTGVGKGMRVKAAVGFAADAFGLATHQVAMHTAFQCQQQGCWVLQEKLKPFSTCGLPQMSAAVCRVKKKSEAAVQYICNASDG